jgi:hypothetical protein
MVEQKFVELWKICKRRRTRFKPPQNVLEQLQSTPDHNLLKCPHGNAEANHTQYQLRNGLGWQCKADGTEGYE